MEEGGTGEVKRFWEWHEKVEGMLEGMLEKLSRVFSLWNLLNFLNSL